MRLLATASLLVATVTTGLTAGLFAGFAYAVMPGLRRADDRTFVTTMQQINRAILNVWFLTCFLGALVALALAGVLHGTVGSRPVVPFVVAALVLYLVVFLVTAAGNVPLNKRLDAAGAPDHIGDTAAVRERFESAWVRWNTVRAVAAIAAFGCLVWALVLHGRTAG